ncbi:archaeosortase/exosortase family protein [Armatimonas sp.]|uniref:archaeosortase/exosortase family protein n=1 Tax=Armatimonas sp. TaxID=1872638 RepID=UPI003751FD83
MTHLQALKTYIVQERRWFILGLIYLTTWIIPFEWMTDWWKSHYSILAAQPFVLPLFCIVLWGRRAIFKEHQATQTHWDRHVGKPQKKGSLTLLVCGSLLYFFAHFSRLSVAAVLGLVLMLVGVIVCVYGKNVIKILRAPILYLLLVIPWLPESATTRVELLGLNLHGTIIRGIVLRLGHQMGITPENITVDGASIPTPFTLSGMQGSFAMIVFFWGYGLYRRYSAQRTMGLIFLGLTITFVVNQLKLAISCWLVASSSSLTGYFIYANCWFFTIPSLVLTLLTARVTARLRRPEWVVGFLSALKKLSNAIQRPIDALFLGSARAGTSIGKGILILFTPLTRAVNFFLLGLDKLGKLAGSSNKNLETLIRRGERKLQNRRKR